MTSKTTIFSRTKSGATALCIAALVGVSLQTAPVFAQTVSLSPPSQSEYHSLIKDWQAKNAALQAAKKAQQEHEIVSGRVAADAARQQDKIDGAKAGLSAAVLKVAEAKNRLAQVDTSTEDQKGEKLSQELISSQGELNQIISTVETAEKTIAELKAEHEKLRSTVSQLKNAVAAARAAVSAAAVYVEAVKSAQIAISESNGENAKPNALENDFFNDAVAQAQTAEKSATVAQLALDATRKRQTKVAEDLLKTEELLAQAKKAEASAYKTFAAADEAFKQHQAEQKIKNDKRDALIASINEELSVAQEQLSAQKEILQAQTLARQELSSLEQSAAETLDGLKNSVTKAQTAFDASQVALRKSQRQRATQSAAILAELNSEMRGKMRISTPGADSSGPTDRLILPTSKLFAKNSAKLLKSDGIRLSELAALAKDAANKVPEGLEYILRIDSYATGKTDESWFLSQNRALTIAKTLIESGKFDPSKVSANSVTNAKPLSQATEDGWIEIVLTAR